MTSPYEDLRGRTTPWGPAARTALWAFVLLGLLLRVFFLSAEGFGDDEVHKWLAANKYLHGDFSGDDVEHPMLMKSLIALVLMIGGPLGWAPETITRLPNAVIGGLSVLVIGLLGRRLFGGRAGLFAAALASVSTTLVGYQRVAKEDTPLGFFLLLLCWCLAEAKAAADDAAAGDPARVPEQRRWELWAALSLAGMLASKYFAWLALVAPLFVWWVRADTAWRVPPKRWLQLIGIAFAAWVAVNWSPFLPSTWEYAKSYTTGQQTVHGSLFFMGRIYHNLVEYGWNGTPPSFYPVFTAVKLTPGTLLLALAGLAIALVQRRPAHKLLLSWMGIWFAIHSLSGSKWGRFYTSVLPAFLLLAAHAAALLVARLQARADAAGAVPAAATGASGAASGVAGAAGATSPRRLAPAAAAALALCALLAVGGEAFAAASHAPHYRLYISPLGGGDTKVDTYFPHCDYFDLAYREAVEWVATHAEPGAELTSEIDWPANLYAGFDGRKDLLITIMHPGHSCRSGRVCYALVQTGRLYFINEAAVKNLAGRAPVHVESVFGHEVVKVYRLAPGESPYPAENLPHP